uniref:Uncharacterized protein n=1 Tax=Coturnix japonica TaxID=93934 RepID=A0A8C2TCS8_COTJA
MLSIQSWLSFYSANYAYVGKLVGRFYDENGAPTEALRQAEAAIEEGLKFKAESDRWKEQFPPCNSEWSSAKGSRFWCSRQSPAHLKRMHVLYHSCHSPFHFVCPRRAQGKSHPF